MHSERKPPTTPICELGESCRVELMAENEVAARIYMMVRGQTIDRIHMESSMGGSVAYSDPIDLNHLALWKAIEKFPGGIKDEWQVFQRVIQVWHFLQQKKRDSEG
jgi:hypothetical protein